MIAMFRDESQGLFDLIAETLKKQQESSSNTMLKPAQVISTISHFDL